MLLHTLIFYTLTVTIINIVWRLKEKDSVELSIEQEATI